MSYQVKLDSFEGPLDLLLYLIRKNDMDIRNVEVSKITQQYLDFINAMRTLDVDLASEFIVMAATLIYIKSKMLLPQPREESPEEEGDPRELLMQRLIEYQKYKLAADELFRKPQLNSDLFKVHILPEQTEKTFDPKESLVEVGVYELALAFQDVLARSRKIVHHIKDDEILLEDKIKEIVGRFHKNPGQKIDFKDLFPKDATRVEIVVTFLALLELTRLKCVKLFQAGHVSDIHLKITNRMLDIDLNDSHFMTPSLETSEAIHE